MDKTINKKLAKRIKALRGEAGLSQQELAERLGISRPTISQIENDERKITADELKSLQIYLMFHRMIYSTRKKVLKWFWKKEKARKERRNQDKCSSRECRKI